MKTKHITAAAVAVLALTACTIHSAAKASGTPPTSSARPSSSATTAKGFLPVKGVPILVDKKGTGNSDLIVLPHSGPLSIKFTCTALSTVTFDMKPDVGSIVTCDPNDTVIDYPKVRSTSRPVRIEAKPDVHWTVSIGLGTTV